VAEDIVDRVDTSPIQLVNLVTTETDAKRYRRNGLWTSDTLSGRVADLARGDRRKDAAVIDLLGQRTRSYADLALDAAKVAAALTAGGVCAGGVVSVQLPNTYDAVVVAVAVNALGAVINPLLPNYRGHELRHVFRTAHPQAVVTPAIYRDYDHLALIAEVAAETNVRPLHLVADAEIGGDVRLRDILATSDAPDLPIGGTGDMASAVSELIFTSGTEATPKAIMHTEETANFAVRATFEDLGVASGDVVWMPSPVGHSTGFNYGIRAALYHGLPLVLQDRWNADEARALIAAHGCSYTLAATTFLDDLVSACESAGTTLPSLTHFGCGGAPVPASLVDRAEAVGIRVLRLYGSTEVLCATWNRRDSPLDKRRSTDGFALQHTDIEVRDEDGRTLTAAGAEPVTGELHTRGPNTSVGFFADPERTAATYLSGGWVKSGDLVRLDADGYLTVVGRKKEIIIRGGINIAPREIEDLISTLPEVRQVAVVGVPDDRLGERCCACVVLHDGQHLDFPQLVERLRATGMATYKLPERLEILAALPTTASGKVQKHVILQQLMGTATQ
jgi:acyl-coenzyme A synthetase/AMP-(fatty) acid ligase